MMAPDRLAEINARLRVLEEIPDHALWGASFDEMTRLLVERHQLSRRARRPHLRLIYSAEARS